MAVTEPSHPSGGELFRSVSIQAGRDTEQPHHSMRLLLGCWAVPQRLSSPFLRTLRGKEDDAFMPELPLRLPPLKSLPAQSKLSQSSPSSLPRLQLACGAVAGCFPVGLSDTCAWGWRQGSPVSFLGDTGQGFCFIPIMLSYQELYILGPPSISLKPPRQLILECVGRRGTDHTISTGNETKSASFPQACRNNYSTSHGL